MDSVTATDEWLLDRAATLRNNIAFPIRYLTGCLYLLGFVFIFTGCSLRYIGPMLCAGVLLCIWFSAFLPMNRLLTRMKHPTAAFHRISMVIGLGVALTLPYRSGSHHLIFTYIAIIWGFATLVLYLNAAGDDDSQRSRKFKMSRKTLTDLFGSWANELPGAQPA
jgi:hypothetical protein